MGGVSSCPFPAPADSERSPEFRLGFSGPERVPIIIIRWSVICAYTPEDPTVDSRSCPVVSRPDRGARAWRVARGTYQRSSRPSDQRHSLPHYNCNKELSLI
ncbi:hypothetical protein J6590_001100 [Homalodisca vitripennis]|nr:hypothetical protein J6590_001100 [Homalodisca vitripennis]